MTKPQKDRRAYLQNPPDYEQSKDNAVKRIVFIVDILYNA